MKVNNTPQTWLVIAAFAVIYTIWGSTYLAIAYAIETIPPLLMAGVRFIVAGSIVYLWLLSRGKAKAKTIHWRNGIIVGGLMLMGGNGVVTWAEEFVASGLAAVLVATVPLWIVIFQWIRPNGIYPGRTTLVGLAIGFSGVALLVGPSNIVGAEDAINLFGAGLIIFAAISWAFGSLYSREANLPSVPLLGVSIEMIGGGVLLIIAATIKGEWSDLAVSEISTTSVIAVSYLIIFGSIIAFTSYIWLLKNVNPTRVATYAYVNPVIAVFLGTTLRNEPLTPIMVIGSGMIVTAVVLINRSKMESISDENVINTQELQPSLVTSHD